jgi:group I intron endonuclease
MSKLKSGVYKITCLATQQTYVGSSVMIKYRLSQHKNLLKQNRHYNSLLQQAWNTYGKELFVFEPYVLCPTSELISLEQWAIDNNSNGFNVAKKAYGSGRRSDIIKIKKEKVLISELPGYIPPRTGLKHSEESKQKMKLIKQQSCFPVRNKKRIKVLGISVDDFILTSN